MTIYHQYYVLVNDEYKKLSWTNKGYFIEEYDSDNSLVLTSISESEGNDLIEQTTNKNKHLKIRRG